MRRELRPALVRHIKDGIAHPQRQLRPRRKDVLYARLGRAKLVKVGEIEVDARKELAHVQHRRTLRIVRHFGARVIEQAGKQAEHLRALCVARVLQVVLVYEQQRAVN